MLRRMSQEPPSISSVTAKPKTEQTSPGGRLWAAASDWGDSDEGREGSSARGFLGLAAVVVLCGAFVVSMHDSDRVRMERNQSHQTAISSDVKHDID